MTRRGRGRRSMDLGKLALAFALVAASQAQAQVKRPEIVLDDAQLFHPATDPSRFVTVYDTRNLDPGRYTLGIYGNYAKNPFDLRFGDNEDESADVTEHVWGADLIAALGITDRVTIGVDIPYVHTRNERVLNLGDPINEGGPNLGDIAAEGKFTLLPRPIGEGFGLSVLPRVLFPTGDRQDLAGTGHFSYGGLVIADARYDKINYGVNVGGFVRDSPGRAEGFDRLDDGMQWGAGVTVPSGESLDVIAELTGRSNFGGSRGTPVEGLLAFRLHWGTLAFTIGGGAGAVRGRGAPEFRVIAGLTPYIAEKEIPPPMADLVTNSRKTWKLADDPGGDGRPNPGDTIEYTITLVNTGTKAADELVFVDPVPDRTSYVPGSLTFQGKPLTDEGDADAGDFNASNPGAVTIKVGTLGFEPNANTAAASFRVRIDPEIVELMVVRNVAVARHKDRPEGEQLPVTETTVFPGIRERETVVVTPEKLEITRNIHFEFDKATIRPESFPILDDVAGVLRDNAELNILIEGHTDSVGGVQYNERLSQRRAASVKTYLVNKGISEKRLATDGKGELAPIASNDTPIGRALNRRVEFLIVNPEVLAGKRIEKRPFIEDITPESEPPSVAPSEAPGAAPTGDRVTLEAQRALSTLGYYRGPVTGIMDSATADALRRFQKENGLTVTGTPDATTRKALDEALELQRYR